MAYSLVCTEPVDVRLIGGTNNCSGTLEILYKEEWRPVAGLSEWNMRLSSVVCRQLGCGSAVSTEKRDGSTDHPTWLIRGRCVGTETSLKECGVMESGSNPISLYLICSGNKQ